MVCTSNCSGAAALGAHVYGCSSLKDWHPGVATGQTEFLSTAAGGVYLGHSVTFPLMPCSGGSRSRMSVSVSAQECLSVICMSSCMCIYVCMYICVWCICVLCVHVPVGKTFSALLLVEPGGMEQQQQPHLSWAPGFGMRYFPLTAPSISALSFLGRHSPFLVVSCPTGLWHIYEHCCKLLMLCPGTKVCYLLKQWTSKLFEDQRRNTQADLSRVHLAQNSVSSRGNRMYCLRTAHKPGHFL